MLYSTQFSRPTSYQFDQTPQRQGLRSYDPIQIPRLPKESGDPREPVHRTFQNEAICRAILSRLDELDELNDFEPSVDEDDCSCEAVDQKVEALRQRVKELEQAVENLGVLIDPISSQQRAFHRELQQLRQSVAFNYQHLQRQVSIWINRLETELQQRTVHILPPAHRSGSVATQPVKTWRSSARHDHPWRRYSLSAQWAFSSVQLLGFAAFSLALVCVAVGFLGSETLVPLLVGVGLPVLRVLAGVALVSFAAASLFEAMRNQ